MWVSFRVWTGRRFSRGRSRPRSSRPSGEKKTSATLTWSSQLSRRPSRRPASAAPSPARNRTTSRILTMSPTSARVRGQGVKGLLAAHCQPQTLKGDWEVKADSLSRAGREELDGDEGRGSLLLCPLSLCLCVCVCLRRDGRLAGPSVCERGTVESDGVLHTYAVSQICRPLEVSTSVTLRGF